MSELVLGSRGGLPQRVQEASRALEEVCAKTPLSQIMGSSAAWAIVGGAVRDAMLRSPCGPSGLLNFVSDIDIAASFDISTLAKRGAVEDGLISSVSTNSFGGLKLQISQLGVVDVWRWNATSVDEWKRCLRFVDFGVNAVAFAWPGRQIIIHPRWLKDLARNRIERLDFNPSFLFLQPVRSIALLVKMERMSREAWFLGRDARRDALWLVRRAGEEEVRLAMNYLIQKVQDGRWSTDVVRRFFAEAQKLGIGDRFYRTIQYLFGSDLGTALVSQDPSILARSIEECIRRSLQKSENKVWAKWIAFRGALQAGIPAFPGIRLHRH